MVSCGNRAATILTGVVAFLPVLYQFGLLDPWLAWAVYSSFKPPVATAMDLVHDALQIPRVKKFSPQYDLAWDYEFRGAMRQWLDVPVFCERQLGVHPRPTRTVMTGIELAMSRRGVAGDTVIVARNETLLTSLGPWWCKEVVFRNQLFGGDFEEEYFTGIDSLEAEYNRPLGGLNFRPRDTQVIDWWRY
ncbi:hypothetical protein [Stratiformator vulcanicus]|uniref:Uncharacterized protein n=1 Tax=Stratiformator vulcanicus TaxID=2527980 RepID=A0A517R709_9PLAN|nr:hypothetical protein [Stratiformator vulcanicus]QDT39676.1 hypothetical protein Pan189_40850 [Stratiformator vulcanicus]